MTGVVDPYHQQLLAFGISLRRGGLLRLLLYSYVYVVSKPGPSQPRKEMTRDRSRRAERLCAAGAEENFSWYSPSILPDTSIVKVNYFHRA